MKQKNNQKIHNGVGPWARSINLGQGVWHLGLGLYLGPSHVAIDLSHGPCHMGMGLGLGMNQEVWAKGPRPVVPLGNGHTSLGKGL